MKQINKKINSNSLQWEQAMHFIILMKENNKKILYNRALIERKQEKIYFKLRKKKKMTTFSK